MSPVGWFLILAGLFLAVVGIRNHQDNLISAIAGKRVGATTLK